MKLKFLKAALTSVIMVVSSIANAGLIYDFDVSDTSWADNVIGDFTGASVSVEFKETTDFNAVLIDDILSAGFSSIFGDAQWAGFTFSGDPTGMFSQVGDNVRLHIGRTSGMDSKLVNFEAYGFMQLIRGDTHSGGQLMLQNVNGFAFAESQQNEVSFGGQLRVDVPEPSTLAIFALGMIGLASRRFKKQ